MRVSGVKPSDRLARSVRLVAVIALLGMPAGTLGTAAAQDRNDLDKLESEIKAQRDRAAKLERKAKALANELRSLRRKSIQTARSTQESESELTRLETELQRTREAVRERESKLGTRKRQLGGTLNALVRLSRNPPQALLLSPGRPIEVVRQAMLLRTALPVIQGNATGLRAEIEELAMTRADIARQLDALSETARSHGEQRKRLDALISRKAALLQQTDAERKRTTRRVERLAREARTLKELFAGLQADEDPPPTIVPPVVPPPKPNARDPAHTAQLAPPRPETLRPFPERGPITLPARGEVARLYGENTGYGNTAKGITIETRQNARIVAPYDGKVVFSGPFRGYGQILIIEHNGGYHTLLAGMTRVDTGVGQWLLAGEPVGVMAKSNTAAPRLYFELRRKGQPVNPLPWFVEYRNKVRG